MVVVIISEDLLGIEPLGVCDLLLTFKLPKISGRKAVNTKFHTAFYSNGATTYPIKYNYHKTGTAKSVN